MVGARGAAECTAQWGRAVGAADPRRRLAFGNCAENPGLNDLVFGNILARPLRLMARDLARYLAPGGVAILAGLLRVQRMMCWRRTGAMGWSWTG